MRRGGGHTLPKTTQFEVDGELITPAYGILTKAHLLVFAEFSGHDSFGEGLSLFNVEREKAQELTRSFRTRSLQSNAKGRRL